MRAREPGQAREPARARAPERGRRAGVRAGVGAPGRSRASDSDEEHCLSPKSSAAAWASEIAESTSLDSASTSARVVAVGGERLLVERVDDHVERVEVVVEGRLVGGRRSERVDLVGDAGVDVLLLGDRRRRRARWYRSTRSPSAAFASSQIESACLMNSSWSSVLTGVVVVCTGTIGALSSPPHAASESAAATPSVPAIRRFIAG